MISNSYDLCDDWGWYVDIESTKPCFQIKTEFVKVRNKKLNQHLNNLHTIIEEDEYDYYMNNQKNIETIELNMDLKKYETIKTCNMVVNIGSTTIITALLTYMLFFVL